MKAYRTKKSGENILRTYDLLLKEWGIPLEERMVPTSFGTAHVIVCGKVDGPPLVLFHGVGDDSALMWIFNAKALGQQYRLYAVDTIGGPGKSIMGEKYNKDFDDVQWIDEILDGLGLEKVSIAGVSNGGYLVQLYTLMRLERVEHAISIAAAVPLGELGNPMKVMMKIFLPEALFPTRRNVMKLMKKLAGRNYSKFTENELIMEHYTWLLKGFNNMAMGYHKIRAFTMEEIDRIRDKVIYLVGLEDPFEKLGGKDALCKAMMKVKFFQDAGHGINHEISEEINEIIIRILNNENLFSEKS